MAVAASPKLWMVSDRRATLPDISTTTSCKRAVAISPTKDHLMAQMPRSEVTIVGSTAPWVWPCPPCPWWWSCGCSSLWACDTGAILPLTSLFTQRRGIGILGSSARPWCSGTLCAMAHIHPPQTRVCCLRYVTGRGSDTFLPPPPKERVALMRRTILLVTTMALPLFAATICVLLLAQELTHPQRAEAADSA